MTHPPSSGKPAEPRTTPMTRAEKDAVVLANRALLDQDLTSGRLVFRSRPRAVDLQLSNFCNMSCTMCYDGNNPPLRKLDEDLVERLAAEILPAATMLTPFAGSEPLLLTWDLTRRLAELYDVELDIVTNAQFLDDAMFAQLEPHVSSLTFSIDSHLRGVYEEIRQRSRPDKVFKNLPRAAQLCREHGIEPVANVVFMVENAPFLEGTIDFLAEQGCTRVRLLEFHAPLDAGPNRRFSDATLHMSPEWIAWKLEQCREVAQKCGILFEFSARDRKSFDYRPEDLGYRPDRTMQGAVWNDLQRFFPGYCVQSVDRVKVHVDGDVYPCCVADGDDLRLGNVTQTPFEEVWNGPTAQDLRRAMLTMDLPPICRDCEFHVAYLPKEHEHMPAVDWFHDEWSKGEVARVAPERRTLVVHQPAHLTRSEASPLFCWDRPSDPVIRYYLVLGVGGEWHAGNRVFEIDGGATEFRIPDADWQALQGNLGYWWSLIALDEGDPANSSQSELARCLVRQQPIPRVEGSRLY